MFKISQRLQAKLQARVYSDSRFFCATLYNVSKLVSKNIYSQHTKRISH